MSDERLSDERVQWFIDHMPEQGSGALAREVQAWRAQFMAVEELRAEWKEWEKRRPSLADRNRDPDVDCHCLCHWFHHVPHTIPCCDQAPAEYRPAVNVRTTIDALCARHDIDIDGIVRLVDEVMGCRTCSDWYAGELRRLARGES